MLLLYAGTWADTPLARKKPTSNLMLQYGNVVGLHCLLGNYFTDSCEANYTVRQKIGTTFLLRINLLMRNVI